MSAVSVNMLYRRGNFRLQMRTEIPEGIVGIFGASGHGKSSLLKLLAGIEQPDEGEIIIRGKTMFSKELSVNVPARRRRVGLVFQEGRLFPHMSVRRNLFYGHHPSSGIHFDEIVDLLELGPLLDKKPQQCSGGEKQRIAIGRMLLSSPQILMLDEPFSALDRRLRHNIIPYLVRIHEKFKLPILVVSHEITDLLMLTDYLLLVQNGQIIGQGTYNELLFQPQGISLLVSGDETNAVRLRAHSIDRISGSTAFYYDSNYPSNCLVFAANQPFLPDDQIILSIAPVNISLSIERVSSISSRNQLQGVILAVREAADRVFCIVDVGFQLLVEITRQAVKQLSLTEGMIIFALFKSTAVKVVRIDK